MFTYLLFFNSFMLHALNLQMLCSINIRENSNSFQNFTTVTYLTMIFKHTSFIIMYTWDTVKWDKSITLNKSICWHNISLYRVVYRIIVVTLKLEITSSSFTFESTKILFSYKHLLSKSYVVFINIVFC